jgi:soluble lytic murein transglycosylase
LLIAGLFALALVLLAQPFLLELQETVRRFTHPLLYEETIRAAAAENGVEPALVAAVIRTESRYDEEVRSWRGAYGLMQILPETARFISERLRWGSSGPGDEHQDGHLVPELFAGPVRG